MKKENLLKIIIVNERVVEEETADILHFFVLRNCIFIKESQGVLKSDVCGNHEG